MEIALIGRVKAKARGDRPGVPSTGVLIGTLGLLIADLALTGAPPGEIALSIWLGITAALGFIIVARARSFVGSLIQVALALVALTFFSQAVARNAVAQGDVGAVATWLAWLSHWLLYPAGGLSVFVFFLFPNGRLPGERWRIAAWAAGVGVVLICAAISLSPGPMVATPAISNPLGIRGAAPTLEVIETAGMLLLFGAVVVAIAGLVVRMRRSKGDERQQVKWLLFAAVLLFVGGFFAMVAEGVFNELSFIGLLVGMFALPLALTVALTKYRLYDIDLVVNRTLVYSILTAAVVVIYILIVGAMGALLQRRVGLVPALVATGIVAVAFQPLRRISQNAVDRLMFGQRRDPYAALANLAGRLGSTFDPSEVLPTIVGTVARSLKLSYAAIEVQQEGRNEVAASEGQPQPHMESTPLIYQGEQVGRLIVAPRRGDALTPTDFRLLEDLARSAGAAVHAVSLTEELRRSRNELLVAREEERRRLRRDLHDGLGPELAGIALGLGAALNLSPADNPEARDLIAKLKSQADSATRSIRSLVDGLRPSALDELGLIEAVREKASAITARGGLAFEMNAPQQLPELSAAVEAAAMRIALEAVTNAVTHSRGTQCSITFRVGTELELEISDDGQGIADNARRGVGLSSMRERAEEVGGVATFDTNGRGTTVRVHLPIK